MARLAGFAVDLAKFDRLLDDGCWLFVGRDAIDQRRFPGINRKIFGKMGLARI